LKYLDGPFFSFPLFSSSSSSESPSPSPSFKESIFSSILGLMRISDLSSFEIGTDKVSSIPEGSITISFSSTFKSLDITKSSSF